MALAPTTRAFLFLAFLAMASAYSGCELDASRCCASSHWLEAVAAADRLGSTCRRAPTSPPARCFRRSSELGGQRCSHLTPLRGLLSTPSPRRHNPRRALTYMNECGYGRKGSGCCPTYSYSEVVVTCRCRACHYSISYVVGQDMHVSSTPYCTNSKFVGNGGLCKTSANVARDGCVIFSVLGGKSYTINGRSFSSSKINLDWTWC